MIGAGIPALGAAALAAVVLGGCGQVVAAGSVPPTHPTVTRSPGQPRPATSLTAAPSLSTSSPTADGPPFVVTRVVRTLVLDGNISFAPPPAGATPRIPAATAFATARHSWGDPDGTARPQVVLMSYTNDGQGDMLPGGGIRRFDVDRLVWAVIDAGATCASSGPPGPGQRSFDDCLVISFVDARTGRPGGHMDEFGRGVPTLRFGPSSRPSPEER